MKFLKESVLLKLFIFLILIININLHAQKSQELLDFYQAEQKTWQEYINHSKFYQSSSNTDISFYHIDVEISVHTPYIAGNVFIKLDITENNTQIIKFNLFRGFTIDSITGNLNSYIFNNDSIIVTLDQIYQSGNTVELNIHYGGVPQLAGGYKGLRYETHAGNQPIIATLSTPFLAHYWWPCKDGPGDKADSLYIDITIPDTTIGGIPLIAVSNGILENVITENGKNKFQWRERYPIVPYYVMAAISNYEHFNQTFTISPSYSFPIDYYVFNEHLSLAQLGVVQMPQTMALFSNLFGEYPFAEEKYGMTQLGYYGAIENQTNTIINNMSMSWYDISVHELAHMWFGDMITCESWQHGWLNEGFATYCEALWEESIGGFQAYKNNINSNRYLQGGTLFLQDDSNPFQIFVGIIYSKGAYVLHMLRGVLGDSLFFDCLYNYSTDSNFMYDHASTEDFQTICETTSGMNLDFFFDQWIYDEYYPQYKYSFRQNDTTFTSLITIQQIQNSNGWREIFEMPVKLQFNFIDNSDTMITVWNDQQTQLYWFDFDKQLSSVNFDPDEWILKTVQQVIDNVPEDRSSIPDKISLLPNYPNPFNPETTIQYNLPQSIHVKIEVFNLLGQKIKTILDANRNAGNHQIQFNAEGIASGVYFYKLEAGNYISIRKLIFIK
jgi:aminopeptidase N